MRDSGLMRLLVLAVGVDLVLTATGSQELNLSVGGVLYTVGAWGVVIAFALCLFAAFVARDKSSALVIAVAIGLGGIHHGVLPSIQASLWLDGLLAALALWAVLEFGGRLLETWDTSRGRLQDALGVTLDTVDGVVKHAAAFAGASAPAPTASD